MSAAFIYGSMAGWFFMTAVCSFLVGREQYFPALVGGSIFVLTWLPGFLTRLP